jgi:hypothetical protein
MPMMTGDERDGTGRWYTAGVLSRAEHRPGRHFRLWRTCVDWPAGDLGLLGEIIRGARDVTRRTFLRRCECDPARAPAWDRLISYHRSRVAGVTYYFYVHSAIEHVFRAERR